MTELSPLEQFITVACVVIGTILTRTLPFLILGGRPTPRVIEYLGRVLPGSVFGLLVVYCFKNVEWLSESHGLPELCSAILTIVLHLRFRSWLLSIGGGTALHMVLVQLVFS